MNARLTLIVVALGAIMIGGACSTPADSRAIATPPDAASFGHVAQALVRHCGSLDCHGTTKRNLRLYGNEGLRLAADASPSIGVPTTDAEVSEDYLSVIGLEPEILSAVVAEGGARPERLTFVRKARGTESHKGDAPLREGDETDVCITSWLAGKTDVARCDLGARQ